MITSWATPTELWLLTDAVTSESQVRAVADQVAGQAGRSVETLYLYSITKRGRQRECRWTAWCPKVNAG